MCSAKIPYNTNIKYWSLNNNNAIFKDWIFHLKGKHIKNAQFQIPSTFFASSHKSINDPGAQDGVAEES